MGIFSPLISILRLKMEMKGEKCAELGSQLALDKA
jgi:hypothetical protein